VGWQTHRIVL